MIIHNKHFFRLQFVVKIDASLSLLNLQVCALPINPNSIYGCPLQLLQVLKAVNRSSFSQKYLLLLDTMYLYLVVLYLQYKYVISQCKCIDSTAKKPAKTTPLTKIENILDKTAGQIVCDAHVMGSQSEVHHCDQDIYTLSCYPRRCTPRKNPSREIYRT